MNVSRNCKHLLLSGLLLVMQSCGGEVTAPPLFRLLAPDRTGVTFTNTITTTDSHNIQTDIFI